MRNKLILKNQEHLEAYEAELIKKGEEFRKGLTPAQQEILDDLAALAKKMTAQKMTYVLFADLENKGNFQLFNNFFTKTFKDRFSAGAQKNCLANVNSFVRTAAWYLSKIAFMRVVLFDNEGKVAFDTGIVK